VTISWAPPLTGFGDHPRNLLIGVGLVKVHVFLNLDLERSSSDTIDSESGWVGSMVG
jgi:hypothetical protein